MKQVTMLAMSEPAQLDAEKLEQLYEELGDSAAEDVVCRAMEELAVKLAQTDRLYRSGQIAEMRKTVRSMGAIAGQIGMARWHASRGMFWLVLMSMMARRWRPCFSG